MLRTLKFLWLLLLPLSGVGHAIAVSDAKSDSKLYQLLLSETQDQFAVAEPIPTLADPVIQADLNLQAKAQLVLDSKDFSTEHFASSLQPGESVYWYRIPVSLSSSHDQASHFYLDIENTIITHFDVFLFKGKQLQSYKRLGIADRSDGNDVYQGVYFPIQLGGNDQATILIRKQSVSPAIMPMKVYSKKGFFEHQSQQYLFWGAALALLVVIASYNAVIYALVKVSSYVWYLGFYLLSFFYFAGLHGYGRLLWGDMVQSWLGQHIMSLNFAVLWVVLNFARNFLDAKENAKWHERYFKWVNWLLLPGFIISFFVTEYQMIPIFGLMQVAGSVFSISMAITAYRNDFYPARLFMLSWAFVLIGAAIGILTYTNLIEASFWTMHGFFFGTILELILLSIALADRLRYSEKRAISNAFIDPQTNLPNFSFFRSEYFDSQNWFKSDNRQAILLIELKGFDHLLGLLGPMGAEKAFRSHIARIERFLNHSNWSQVFSLPDGQESRLVALPGDQLLVIAEIENDYESILLPLIHLAETRIRIGKLDNQLSIQVGVADFNLSVQSLQDSYRHAQLALIKAKSEHRIWAVYQKEDEEYFRKKSALLADLRQAIEDEQLTIYIQPQFDCHDQILCGGEVLVRWKHKKQGMISPGIFIPLAEESNLIFKITKQVLHKSFDWLAEHPQDPEFQLSINLSGIDIQHSELVPYVRWQLERTHIAPPQVTFEVTESAASLDQNIFLKVIAELKELGFNLAIDDFGTGYSSMSYIQQLNADFIKVDMTFVRDIDTSPVNQNIVEAVVQMAESTTAKVVAEGVETESELYKLQLLGVHKVQGFLLGKPVPALAFDTHFNDQSLASND